MFATGDISSQGRNMQPEYDADLKAQLVATFMEYQRTQSLGNLSKKVAASPQTGSDTKIVDVGLMLDSLESQKAELMTWLTRSCCAPAGSAPRVQPFHPTRKPKEAPGLLATKLSVGASFGDNSSAMPKGLDGERNGIQPADTKTMPDTWFMDKAVPRHLVLNEEVPHSTDGVIGTLQTNPSHQSLVYGQQVHHEAPESDVWEAAMKSRRPSCNSLYTASTTSPGTTSPRDSMHTSSDEDIQTHQVVPRATNGVIAPPPGLEHVVPRVPVATICLSDILDCPARSKPSKGKARRGQILRL
jgi:hypothetical protein